MSQSHTAEPGNRYRVIIQASETPRTKSMIATPIAKEEVLTNNSGMRVVQSRRQMAISAVTAENKTYNRGSVTKMARKKAIRTSAEGKRKGKREKLREELAEANVFNHGHSGITEFRQAGQGNTCDLKTL